MLYICFCIYGIGHQAPSLERDSSAKNEILSFIYPYVIPNLHDLFYEDILKDIDVHMRLNNGEPSL